MDGLSAAASVIAVAQISGQVFDLCRTYYLEVKEARKDIQRLRDEVTSLQDVLTNVADLAETPGHAKLSIFNILNQPDGPVQRCHKDLLELVTKLETGQGQNKMRQFGLRALKWPFSSKDVEKLLTTIGRHKTTFNMALSADQIGLLRAMRDDVVMLNNGMEELRIGQRTSVADGCRQKIHQWLSPPDPSSNHNAACKKRQPTTGTWFTESNQFKDWKNNSNSFLWLHGIPGCGKTVLCSAIAQEVIQDCKLKPGVAVAYFYFDFNDNEKQRYESLMRSLIIQFSSQSEKIPESLYALFARNQDGQQQPAADSLRSTLHHVLKEFQQTFIILDALDECKEREELLDLIENMFNWKLETLHILATSRRERDIEETLEHLVTEQICIQSALVNADIHTHICERLKNDPKLKKWPRNVQIDIEKTLMDGAHGMFRWVVCQLDALRKCLKLDVLRKALRSLPKTLDETYSRILCDIDEDYSQDAFRILQWLVYSARPLSIKELAEVIAVNLDDPPQFDPENRLPEPRDILTICSSLVTTTISLVKDSNPFATPLEVEQLRLAHFSVKEYLVSDRIRLGPASRYSIKTSAQDEIAQTSLVYLLHFKDSKMLTSDNFDQFWLARYAAQYWTEHARAVEGSANKMNQLIMELFQLKDDAYINWLRLCDIEKPWIGVDMRRNLEHAASPIYYSALVGLIEPLKLLLKQGANIHAEGGVYGNALQAASGNGHKAIVRLLLEQGANIEGANDEGGRYGNALHVSSRNGHEAVVRLLLEQGANINADGGRNDSALQAASGNAHKAIVRLLLEQGANVEVANVKGGYYGNALQVASEGGHEAIVRLLLEKGADINTSDGFLGSALQAASVNGYEAIVRLLLELGANVDAEGGHNGSAIQAASRNGHEAIVRLLLELGANVNAEGGHNGSAIQAASENGHEAIVRLLLEQGANINVEDGYYGSALQVASRNGHEAIVRLLLELGANINAEGEHNGSGLQGASEYGHEAIVRLLLQKGADINTEGGVLGNALQAASRNGHEAIVRLLLEQGS